jgi:hypothetical protein
MQHLLLGEMMRSLNRVLYLLAVIFLAGLFVGCQKPIVYAAPILPEPDQPISAFVQETHTWICAPSTTLSCTQQVFTWTVPKVQDGDTLKVVFWWFVGVTPLSPSQVPVVTDSVGSRYTLVQEQPNSNSSQYGFIFSTPQVNSNGNDVQVTVTLPLPADSMVDLDALEYSAGANLDNAAGATGYNPGPLQAGPLTVSSNGDVLLSIYHGQFPSVTGCPTCAIRYNSPHSSFIVQDFFPSASGNYIATFPAPSSFAGWSVSAASFQ